MPSLSSAGSMYVHEDYKQNNLCDTNDEEQGDEAESVFDEEDPDAMDEAVQFVEEC